MSKLQRCKDHLKSILRHLNKKAIQLLIKERRITMYLICKRCGTDDIELTSPYDRYPFYCNKCKRYIKFDDVKEYRTLSTHYSNTNFKSLLVISKD